MGGLFGGGAKAPAPKAPTPIPVKDDERVRSAALAEQRRLRGGSGRDSTFLDSLGSSKSNLG